MADDSIENVYASVGCNRTPHALDWGHNGLVCFAASHAVAIYDPGVCINILFDHVKRKPLIASSLVIC